ncbi:MAG: DDE-type integrase/transposase/recombinase [Nanoarchaeota archaeon]|nr:DDE-type integrase/transposase/recombinase [Nanoarchaeota archaeon]
MEKIKCSYCKSEHIVKRGLTSTKSRGKQQRYLCKDCNRTFILDNGFKKMKFNDKIIAMSVDMYLSNLSSRKMRNQLKRHFGVNVSHETILSWVRKYVLKVHNYVEKLKYNLGNRYYADETVIKRKGNEDRFWACVDWNTRMITGIHYTTRTNTKEAITFLNKAVAKGKPISIRTDSAKFYPRAFHKVFYKRKNHYNKNKGLDVQHHINNVNKTKIHNYKIETVFMKIKDRVNDFRGLKALWSAPIILAGLVLQHNFIEEHLTTRKVPCSLAMGDICKSDNRWLELIKISS